MSDNNPTENPDPVGENNSGEKGDKGTTVNSPNFKESRFIRIFNFLNRKWLKDHVFSICRHALALILVVIAAIFLITSSISIIYFLNSQEEEYLVTNITKTYYPEPAAAASIPLDSAKGASQTAPAELPAQANGAVAQVINMPQDAPPKATDSPQLKEIKEISHAPKVWVLFLLLSAAVGSLWAILWAVVSLCRTD